jgi:branched-chain amino acid transport system substrate-binding protein
MRALIVMLVCAATGVFLWLHWPGTNYAELAAARDQRALDRRGDIVIAAVMDARQSDYVNGIRLAVHEINCEAAAPPHQPVPGCKTLLGRRVVLRVKQATDDPQADMHLVDQIVRDDEVVAVFGHRSSREALPVSRVYESARVIFMSPFATRKSLTGHAFEYVFRMAPSSPVMAEQLASLTSALSYDRVAIVHSRDDYSRELAFLFEDAALARGLQISRRRSFLADEKDYRTLISELRAQPLDAVFLSAPTDAAARMARQLRELGVTAPIIGTDIDPEGLRWAAGPAGERTILPVLYRASQAGWRNAGFVKAFQATHDRLPDANAAQGYDSMLLLASAIRSANTTRTSAVTLALHFMPFWIGVTGLHAFDQHGELLGKHYQFQWLHDGTWSELPGLQRRFQLERAEKEALRSGAPLATNSATLRDDTPADQVRQLQLDLARHILQWDRLDVVVAIDEGDSPVKVLQALKALTGTAAEPCVVRAATLDADLASCLQQLPAESDALMLARFDHLGLIDDQGVQARLRRVDRPVFALSSLDNDVMPPGLSLYIDVAAKQADFLRGQQLVTQLAPRQAVESARQRLANLPLVQADLQALQDLGVQKNAVLLDLYAQELPPAPPREHLASLAARVRAAAAAAQSASDPTDAPAPASSPASTAATSGALAQ